jgi:hypothetical protein
VLKRLDEDLRNGFAEATDQDYAAIRIKLVPLHMSVAETATRR